MIGNVLLLLFAIVSFVFALPTSSCPFSNPPAITCSCDGSALNTFQNVVCQLGNVDTLPKFDTFPGKYKITGKLLIQFTIPKAFYIESDSFIDFSSIGQLSLESLNGITSISWNQSALRSTQILQFKMNNIFHFNSAFAALQLQKAYLQSLELDSGGAYHLGGYDLKDFKSLKALIISDTDISTIDDTAFAGLEQVLEQLSLTDAGVSDRLIPALRDLAQLKKLNLSGNDFDSVDLVVFSGLETLNELVFDRNDGLKVVFLSDLIRVRTTLNRISIKQAGLKSISSTFAPLLDRPQFQLLDVSGNTKLICDENVQWAAKYAFCNPARLNISAAICSNLQKPLADYLKESVKNPCS